MTNLRYLSEEATPSCYREVIKIYSEDVALDEINESITPNTKVDAWGAYGVPIGMNFQSHPLTSSPTSTWNLILELSKEGFHIKRK